MTNTPFSPAFQQHILNIVMVHSPSGMTDHDLANMIVNSVSYHPTLSQESHDFDQVVDRVKTLRAWLGAPAKKSGQSQQPAQAPSTTVPVPSTGSAGTSGWGNTWSRFVGNISAPVQSFVGAMKGGVSSALSGHAMANVYRPIGKAARAWAKSTRFGGGSWVGVPQRARGAGRGRGAGARHPVPGPPPSPSPVPTQKHAAQKPPTPGPGPHQWSWNKFKQIDPWQLMNLMPGAQGTFGKVGAGVGAAVGAGFGIPIAGQAAGTIIGNFVEQMKDAVTQAHAFAIALKESNSRFIYYNASIAMSYVESDVASMIRDMRIAKAIAPSTVSLNRTITAFEQTLIPRDIFRGNIANEFRQAALVPQQAFQELAAPFYAGMNEIMKQVSPKGDLLSNIARAIIAPFYALLPGVGPVMAVNKMIEAAQALMGLGGQPAGVVGGWENFLNTVGQFRDADTMFNRRPQPRFGPGRRRL